MQYYILLVKTHPIIMAMIQFAILGTFGEIISKWIINKKISLPFRVNILILKMLEWAILAVFIKYAFAGFHGFIETLINNGMLPKLNLFFKAFAISVATNIQFGLFLVLFHRILDNLVMREKNWNNIDKGFYSLLWFWIPAHTITFMLPKVYQIGLAALWSVALGIILGFYNKKEK
jgi:hypothetical protein